jgi:hypothetical protein
MVTRFLIAAALVIAPAVALATPASAVTPTCGQTFECITTYYNNADHAKTVGSRTVTCDDQVVITGTTSDFLSFQFVACPPGGE